MKFTLTDPRLLRESINIISEFINEVTFRIDSDKIEVTAIDPANVAMVDFKLLSSAFAEYEVEKPTSLSINLESFKSILKRAKPTDSIGISLDEARNRLKINLIGENKRDFSLSLLNIEDSEQKIPSLNFAVKIGTPTLRFDEAVEDMDVIAESVALVAEADKFTVKSESNLRDAKVEIPVGGETSVDLASEGKVISKYSIEYLKKMIKGSKLAESVSIQFGEDYPLRLEYRVMDKLQLGFVLAPRVSND
jgi:proliferating cell nuclear antigen